MSKYLRREADSFVFRRRVPGSIQSRLGTKEIYRSLKTTVRRTAQARAAHLFIATERLFQVIDEDDGTLSDEDIQAAVRHWLGTSYAWKNRLDGFLKSLPPGSLRQHHENLPDILLDMGKPDHVSSNSNLIEEAWTALEYSEYAGWGTGDTLTKTMSMFRKVLKEYVDRRMLEVFEPQPLAPVNNVVAPVTTVPANMSKISTFVGKWQQDICAGYNGGRKLGDETTDQYRQSVELFIGLMGDLPVGKISFDLAAEFREKILKLPNNHGKGRTGSVKKELALAKGKTEAPRLTMKTAKRHFSGMNSIWKWLMAKRHVPAQFNPFAGHSFPGTKSTKSARDAWSSEDLERLFSSPPYRGASSRSALYWLPLISLFSGLRLEEICRLRPDQDLIVRDRIYCFDIKRRPGWDPKSEAGSRVVPVHSWLLSNGFKEFVDTQRASRSEHLFPELKLHRNKLSSGFSREFSRMKTEIGVGKKTTFHSFRHTFRTVLGSTDHKDSHIDAVMGHEGGGSEGRVYDKGVTTLKLKEVVESFRLAFDPTSFPHDAAAPTQPLSNKQRGKSQVVKRKLVPPIFDANGRVVRTRRSAK